MLYDSYNNLVDRLFSYFKRDLVVSLVEAEYHGWREGIRRAAAVCDVDSSCQVDHGSKIRALLQERSHHA